LVVCAATMAKVCYMSASDVLLHARTYAVGNVSENEGFGKFSRR